MRRFSSLVCLAFLGCQSMVPSELAVFSGPTELARIFPAALRLPALRDDPLLPEASRALERGDHPAACELLRQYAERHPESKHARAFYAEVLARLGKSPEACVEFEKAVARLQEDKSVDLAMIVHCHGRLLDLADDNADDYRVRLHRGLGLYWLAQQKRSPAEPDDSTPTEAILCKAALELTMAHILEPTEPRPTWYLHLIWRQLGQSAPAQRWLLATQTADAGGYLTPREQSDLLLRSMK